MGRKGGYREIKYRGLKEMSNNEGWAEKSSAIFIRFTTVNNILEPTTEAPNSKKKIIK